MTKTAKFNLIVALLALAVPAGAVQMHVYHEGYLMPTVVELCDGHVLSADRDCVRVSFAGQDITFAADEVRRIVYDEDGSVSGLTGGAAARYRLGAEGLTAECAGTHLLRVVGLDGAVLREVRFDGSVTVPVRGDGQTVVTVTVDNMNPLKIKI